MILYQTSATASLMPMFCKMLYTFVKCKELYGSPYQISKAISDGRLHKLSSGVYSDTGKEDELEVIQWQYPNAILTLDSAYFYYDLTDVIPSRYHFATDRKSRVIHNPLVRQIFVPADILDIGKSEISYNGDAVRTYDLERLLIETARYKAKLAPDLYKEVILSFRRRTDQLDAGKIASYLQHFSKCDLIESVIYEEVF